MNGLKIFTWGILLLLLVPVFSIIALSFGETDGNLLKWYTQTLHNREYLSAVKLSVLIAGITAVFSVLFSFIISLAWFKKRHRRIAIYMILLLGLIPPDILVLGISRLGHLVGVNRSNLFLLSAGLLTYTLPYCIVLVWAGYYYFPPKTITVARDLGAGTASIVANIIWPLSRPMIISSFLLSFLLVLNEFPRTYYLSGSSDPVSTYLYGKLSSGTDRSVYGGSSLSVLITIVFILFIMLLQKTAWKKLPQ